MYKKLSNPAYCLYLLIKSDMKIFWKLLGISLVCTTVFFWLITKAATWDITGTGNISTWGITTGTVNTWTISYTWSLLTYLTTQESGILALSNTTYGQVYTAFSKTWLNILKSIGYQSLVCLWAIKDVSFLAQFQKDKTALTIAFQQDFVDIQNQILSLEDKQSLQTSGGVNVFDSGTTYESEKLKIKNLIDTKVALYQWLLATFATNYAAKNIDFLTTYLQYSAANQTLIQGIQTKMNAIQSVLNAFSWVEDTITAINAKIPWLDDVIQKIETAKTAGLANLDTTFQTLIDATIKKYTTLQNLSGGLSQQKAYIINEYQTDFTTYLNNTFQGRYDRSQYLALKDQIDAFEAKYYTINNQLNCTNILAMSDQATELISKITNMQSLVDSWLAKIWSDGISTTFSDQLYSGFQALYIQQFKQRYTEYTTYIKNYIMTAFKNSLSSLTSTVINTVSTTWTSTPTVKAPKYTFTKPFQNGEYNQGIKTLQNILTKLQLYSWAIDGIYSKATKNAVYQFQLNKGLLKGYKNKPAVWWRMGPATRAALNKLSQ